MFSLTVRDSMMVAHSLKDPSFGPAQRLHGATFIVDLQFIAETLDSQNVVIDIQVARDILGQAIAPLAFQNLDDLEEFHGHLTTAEYLAAHICARTR
ncbi:MAG: 6-carboxytetrahydropterin synthase, partial [Phycisphaerae bacterium]|nr:6-carboxytetrahydropterin synthase [Phycisphaerae bacterium]NIP55830.1 6-carboxytetrahydropterin synthase [Phycisphaerae bacterium]NIX32217.1 6-carboxytetrahydropterin synthase [Phycisphaerae bacterium]